MSFQDLAAVYDAHNRNCAACGAGNPYGLEYRAHHPEADTATGTVRFTTHHEGGVGVVHGGLVATALDELLGRIACVASGGHAVTARLEIDYRAPVPSGHEYTLKGHVESVEGRKVWLHGTLSRDGVAHAEARALCIRVGDATSADVDDAPSFAP